MTSVKLFATVLIFWTLMTTFSLLYGYSFVGSNVYNWQGDIIDTEVDSLSTTDLGRHINMMIAMSTFQIPNIPVWLSGLISIINILGIISLVGWFIKLLPTT